MTKSKKAWKEDANVAWCKVGDFTLQVTVSPGEWSILDPESDVIYAQLDHDAETLEDAKVVGLRHAKAWVEHMLLDLKLLGA